MFSKDKNNLKNEDLFQKKVKSILNKLSRENVEKIFNEFEELSIDSEEKMISCMELVFEKAVDEPASIVACAHICKRMEMKTVLIGGREVVNFRKIIISRCQREFEKLCMADLDQDKYLKNKNEAKSEDLINWIKEDYGLNERRIRQRSLGTIGLISELYKLQVLTAIIMHVCIKSLLEKGDDHSLECLCHLLTEVGQLLDEETRNRLEEGNVRLNKGVEDLNKYFKQMKSVMKDNISHRIRLLIREVIDLRLNSWKKSGKDDGPNTLDHIQKVSCRMAEQSELGGDVFDAQEIVEERIQNGTKEYLIKWKGWSLRDSTWEPIGNILDQRLLQQFQLRQQQSRSKEISRKKHVACEVTASNSNKQNVKTETLTEELELPIVLPKSVTGSRNYWQQRSISNIFNLKQKGQISDIQMTKTLNAPKEQISNRYNQYILNQEKIDMLKQMDTYSSPRLKTACDFKCNSCERNYPNEGSLKTHLMYHIKNVKLHKRNKAKFI